MKVLITTSTFPATDSDKVPAFVKDQAIELKKRYPAIKILIHAPHNHYARTAKLVTGNRYYQEFRYHYFWPRRWELLTGRGIMPALRQNRLLYGQIPFLFAGQFFSLLSLTRAARPDLIYAHWFTPQAIAGAMVSRLTGTPLVFTTHASDVSVLRVVPFSKRLVEWVCTQAAAYTAVSERTAGRLKAFWDKDGSSRGLDSKLRILPMGVHLDKPAASPAAIGQVRDRFRLPEDKFYLLFLGRLAEIKGVEYLIRALSVMPAAAGRELHLVIAGDGHTRPELARLAARLGVTNLTFAGYVHGEVKDVLIALADAVCVPSIVDRRGHREGLPVVIMESLAAGKIVLASDAAGADRIITDGQNGLVFARQSAESLKDAVLKAMELKPSERKAMTARARRAARAFDWGELTRQYYEIFQEAAGK